MPENTVPECPFDEAFAWALMYDGYDEAMNAMIEYLAHGPRNKYGSVPFPTYNGCASRCVTRDDVINDAPNSILWMCVVQMFGDYGTSPRGGWVTHPDEAAEWLKGLRRRTYGIDHYESGEWLVSDEEYAEMAREWEEAARMEACDD